MSDAEKKPEEQHNQPQAPVLPPGAPHPSTISQISGGFTLSAQDMLDVGVSPSHNSQPPAASHSVK